METNPNAAISNLVSAMDSRRMLFSFINCNVVTRDETCALTQNDSFVTAVLTKSNYTDWTPIPRNKRVREKGERVLGGSMACPIPISHQKPDSL